VTIPPPCDTVVEPYGGVVGARGRWFITPHAVRRYRKRVVPGASFADALECLIVESERAHRVRALPYLIDGKLADLWRGARPHRLRFYVVADEHGRHPALITVVKGTEKRC